MMSTMDFPPTSFYYSVSVCKITPEMLLGPPHSPPILYHRPRCQPKQCAVPEDQVSHGLDEDAQQHMQLTLQMRQEQEHHPRPDRRKISKDLRHNLDPTGLAPRGAASGTTRSKGGVG